MSDRILYKDKTLVVLPLVNSVKNTVLFIWLMLWTTCGIIIMSSIASNNYSKETKLAMIVWLAFWAYFEYKIAYVYFWKKIGKEEIVITDGKLILQRGIGKSGTPKQYFIENIMNLRLSNVVEEDKNFFAVMSNSYWTIGAESILFTYAGKDVGLGLQLTKKEATSLNSKIKSLLTQELKKQN